MSAPASGSRIGLPTLWFGVVGAPAAWTIHLLINYPLATYACYRQSAPGASPSSSVYLAAGVVVSVVAFAVGVAALWVALRQWRERPKNTGAVAGTTTRAGRTRFMLLSGIFLSTVFLVGIVLNSSALLLASPCW